MSKITETGHSQVSRRRLLQGSAALTAFAIGAPFIGTAKAQSILKIGMVLPKQGPQTEQASFVANGCRIALDDVGSKVLGQACEITWLDEPNAQTAQQNMQKLISEEKVIGVVGGGNSATALAMAAVAKRNKMPIIIPNAAAREITGKECNRYAFRTQATVPVACRAMAPYLFDRGKRWYFLTANYAFGQDIATTFRELLKAGGGTEVGSDQTPTGTTDYSSFILKIRQAKPDVVVAGIPGDDLSNFLKQFAEMGLKGKIPVACPIIGDSDLEAVGPEVATGIYGKPWDKFDPSNSDEEKKFAASFQAKFGKPVNDKAFLGWISMKMLLAAVEEAKSTEPGKIVEALEGLRLKDNLTPIYFRKWDHQLLRRWLVVGIKEKITGPRDYFDILKSVPESADKLEALYGTPAEIGCTMDSI